MSIILDDILWILIDIPKFPIDNFILDTDTSWAYWNFIKLTESTRKYQPSEIKFSVKEKYPRLIEWLNLFPFDQLSNVKFNIQSTNNVNPHVDFHAPNEGKYLYNNNVMNEPCGYRVILSGERTNKLYIMTNRGKEFVTMPYETDVYVLGQTNCLHGVDSEIGRQTLYLHGYINSEKHSTMLKKSWNKYHQFAIMK